MLLVLGLTLAAGCASLRIIGVPTRAAGRTHAVLLNGGGRPETNYHSHLENVKRLTALLTESGVPSRNITIFSSDGEDPAADLASRELLQDEDFWLLPRVLERLLQPPKIYMNSSVAGFSLQPATGEALRAFFMTARTQLRAGDTLIFYVTDHGDPNKDDPTDNTITLWNESLSVNQLRGLFGLLDPGVRVVMLMSQCFSGSFANAILPTGGNGLPTGNVCGYFAAPADRPAYGCYPENIGKEGVGHSHAFLEALQLLSRFSEAHRRVLVTDDTPDVPFSTADFYLTLQLRRLAEESGRPLEEAVDELLNEAWQDRAAWEPEIRLLDRIGLAFGSFSPRSMSELRSRADTLPQLSQRLGIYAKRWWEALEALKVENLRRFLDANPQWREPLTPAKLKQLDEPTRRATARLLLAELRRFTEADAALAARMRALRRKAEMARRASYRAEVRLGVVLRMKALLISIAGRVYLARSTEGAQRQALARLDACEELMVPQPAAVASAGALPAPLPFPPLAEERRLVEEVMPAWMGIQYQPLAGRPYRPAGLNDGAVVVSTVYPDSPAMAAGMQAGDIILGPPNAPFAEPHQLREWTMGSEIGVAEALAILRDNRLMRITLKPAPFPLDLPELPGPPQIGSAAPALKVDLLRGTTRLAESKPRVLFFWATWCRICHSALRELLAFGAARGAEIVAITDEDGETVRRFLSDFHEPFPAIVAVDPYRLTFQSYGVSGTPTFVLTDAKGVIRHYQTGYSPETGLRFEGWEWQQAAERTSSPAR